MAGFSGEVLGHHEHCHHRRRHVGADVVMDSMVATGVER
jgi:hypothetical protein